MRTVLKLSLAACCGLVTIMAGCGQFFPPLNPPCTTNCTTSGNYLYVANAASTAASIAGFAVAGTGTSTTLTATSNSPYGVGTIPSAVAIAPNNQFMYVAGATGGIYLYLINSNGSISASSSNPVATGIVPQAMQVDSTGAWLLVTTASLATSNAAVVAYPIDSSTGVLSTPPNNATVLPVTGSSSRMLLAPNNANLFVSLGVAGVATLTFNATSGLVSYQQQLAPRTTNGADTGMTTDPNSVYLFVGETVTGGVRVLAIGANGKLTEVAGSPYKTGPAPSALLVEASGSYVYVADSTNNNISGFVLAANGTLSALSGSPYATGTTPVWLAEDNAKAHLAAACTGGNHDLELYSFDATTGGKLDSAAQASTGTDPTNPIIVVATH